METVVPDNTDIPKFLTAWVHAAGEASGTCARITAELEPLESQAQLMGMIRESAEGITQCRKALTALGGDANAESVEGVLRTVPRFQYSLDFFDFLPMHISFLNACAMLHSLPTH